MLLAVTPACARYLLSLMAQGDDRLEIGRRATSSCSLLIHFPHLATTLAEIALPQSKLKVDAGIFTAPMRCRLYSMSMLGRFP